MKNLLICLCLLNSALLGPAVFAGESLKDKTLDSNLINELKGSFKKDPATVLAINAVTNNSIDKIALERQLLLARDREFTHVIRREGVTDQKISGRCWIFAGLNLLRYRAEKKLGIKDFELSQNFSFFWHKLELANTFFEEIIKTAAKPHDDREIEWLYKHAIGDGGYWNMVVSNIEKYGVVPKSVMPDTLNAEDTRRMNSLLELLVKKHAVKLRELASAKAGAKKLNEYKINALKEVYRFLAICLTEPPDEFEWRYTKDKAKKPTEYAGYTPLEFYRKYADVGLKDIIAIYNDPSRPFYKKYSIKWTKSVIEDTHDYFINVPMAHMLSFSKESVLKNDPIWFGADVSQERHTEMGILKTGIFNYRDTFGIDFAMTKEERLMSYASAPNHAMVITGIDIKDGSPVKWLVENSWGGDTAKNSEKGYMIMHTDWFEQYVYATMIDRKYLPKEVLEAEKLKPIELKPWDPVWRN